MASRGLAFVAALTGGLALLGATWLAHSFRRRSKAQWEAPPGQDNGDSCHEAMARYRLVLVDPQDSRNVGMVARVCANFDVEDVWLVSPKQVRHTRTRKVVPEPEVCEGVGAVVWPFDAKYWRFARTLATEEGLPVLDRFRVVETLAEAMHGTQRAVAFSGKRGENFRLPNVHIHQIPTLVPEGQRPGPDIDHPLRIALVFGNEAMGLSTNDTLRCGALCTIPTGPRCTSLNLSHAVAVVLCRLYEWHALGEKSLPSPPRTEAVQGVAPLATDHSTACFMDGLRAQLEALGYPTAEADLTGRARTRNKFAYRIYKHLAALTHVLHRGGATEQELHSLQALCRLLGSKAMPQTEPCDG
eukprot:GGOE01021231.1.p1 GENE.GGOE01021231.1~~GGOE01021231.1.p1  ORF type:complete len:357 (+),score=65.30 GGOE01021231.1:29-1099(+)